MTDKNLLISIVTPSRDKLKILIYSDNGKTRCEKGRKPVSLKL